MKVLLRGNEAIGAAAIEAGCEFYAGYPITPQNELTEYMAKNMINGKVFIQSESEIAAINMVFGASAVGSRAMTSSSSPGISLKQEGISYIAACELPAVIVNVVRGGPGLGNIMGSQSDYFQSTRGGGHGDYRTIVLAPASVQEAYDLTIKSFDLADKYRIPVLLLADGFVGQMAEPLELKKYNGDKVSKDWILNGAKGRKSRVIKSLFLEPGVLEELNEKFNEKYKKIVKEEQDFESYKVEDANLILVGYGIVARICKKAVDDLRKDGIKVGLIRPISLWPFPFKAFSDLIERKFLVVEMSLGQMIEDVKLSGCNNVEFYGRAGGWLPKVEDIVKKIKGMIDEKP